VTVGLIELPRERTQLLDNLGWIRRNLGPVTPELSDALADHMNIRRGEVAEVASFYSYLRLPADVVRVCTGPVCECLGGRALLEQSPGAVEVPCIGHCDLAPAMMRGDEVVPAVTHAANHGPSIDLLASDEPRDPPALDPDPIVAELEASGLVGYGGAGFPTFRKWAAVRDYPGPRVVIVNADEGEPGTIKDRYVMELRPHLLVEGIEIALRFAEADEGYVYLREEYTTARERLSAALAARGLPVTIVTGAGSYVCGEETAMLESMEGRRGMPRLRPPVPVEAGFLGRPTLINNVETLAHIPAVLRLGGAAWPRVRLWSVSGAVANPG
jgi:formate dehydrogenase